jgi:hypothetical protein
MLKAYSMLSLVCFFHYFLFQSKWQIKLICDNEDLITQLKSVVQYTSCFLNGMLLQQPDWDLTNVITYMLHTTCLQPTFDHINGHHHKHVFLYNLLPLVEAQINFEVDHEVAYHQQITHIPIIPATSTMLHLELGTPPHQRCNHVGFSLEWSRLQDQYLEEQGIYMTSAPQAHYALWVVTHMVTIVWQHFLTIWETRKHVRC